MHLGLISLLRHGFMCHTLAKLRFFFLESAAAAIIKYLEPENVGVGEFGGRGWHLLASLTYLAECANNAAIVEAMCHAALASTLVKSLYLFYDLPAPSADPKSVERRNLLYDSVVEVTSSSIGEISNSWE